MSRRPSFHLPAAAALALAVVATSGCSWFRKTNEMYAQSPETRPLEVPPDLTPPDTSKAMQLPGSVTRSQMSAPAASNTGFTVATPREQAFERVGEALAATTGVTVVSRAQILGTYDVDYAGSKFLVRVSQAGEGSYVSAVDPRGQAATGEAPVKLIAALKAALGG